MDSAGSALSAGSGGRHLHRLGSTRLRWGATAVAVGDFNGDGRPDVAVGGRERLRTRSRSLLNDGNWAARHPPPPVAADQRRDRHGGEHGHRRRHLHRHPVRRQHPDGHRRLRDRQRHRHRRQRLPGRERHADLRPRRDQQDRHRAGQRRPPRRAERDLLRQPERSRPTRPSPTARAWAPSWTTSRASASAT